MSSATTSFTLLVLSIVVAVLCSGFSKGSAYSPEPYYLPPEITHPCTPTPSNTPCSSATPTSTPPCSPTPSPSRTPCPSPSKSPCPSAHKHVFKHSTVFVHKQRCEFVCHFDVCRYCRRFFVPVPKLQRVCRWGYSGRQCNFIRVVHLVPRFGECLSHQRSIEVDWGYGAGVEHGEHTVNGDRQYGSSGYDVQVWSKQHGRYDGYGDKGNGRYNQHPGYNGYNVRGAYFADDDFNGQVAKAIGKGSENGKRGVGHHNQRFDYD